MFHNTSCNLHACDLYYTVTYTTFPKMLAGKHWLLTVLYYWGNIITFSMSTSFFNHNLKK